MTETSRWRHRLFSAARVVLVAGFALRPQALAADQPLAVVLGGWTTAVMHHSPGASDAALAAVWAMTPTDREVIRDSLPLFLRFLDGADFSKAKGDVRIVAEAARSLFPISRSDFLERAATLHADAVIFDTRPPGPPVFDLHVARGSFGASDSWGQAAYFSSSDGEFLNPTIENPNWPLARLLLDELPPGDGSQAFATTWYHGVTAYLLGQGNFGQAETNLNHATRMMPGSAQILFDLGCVAETQGMNLFQQVILDDRDPIFRGRPGISGIVTDTSWVTWARVSAPRASPKERSAQAEGLFERALAIDPHLPEARVRWARLLELDKRWTDATRQIGLALSDHPDRDATFFAHLFGARAANALNSATDAEAHLTQALRLFPHAESAILEASATALTHTDPVLAKSRLMSLADPDRDMSPATDPWMEYPLGPGRLPDPPLQAMWRAVPTVRQSEPRTWFPQQVGARWEYRHELRQNSMQPGSGVETTDERWRTTEEITRSTVTDLGTLLTIHAQVLDPAPAAVSKNWPARALDPHVLIRDDCAYVLDGPDALDVPEPVGPAGELSPALRARLVEGRVPADYCFPLAVSHSWGRVPSTSGTSAASASCDKRSHTMEVTRRKCGN